MASRDRDVRRDPAREPDRPSTFVGLLGDISARADRSAAGCRRQVAIVLAFLVPVLTALGIACLIAIDVDVPPAAAAVGAAAVGSTTTVAAAGHYVKRRRSRHPGDDDPAAESRRPAA